MDTGWTAFHYYPAGEGIHACCPDWPSDFMLLKNSALFKKSRNKGWKTRSI